MSDYLVADDLSGALDAAGAFHRAGRRVTIVLSAAAWPPAGGDEVVAFTTETRNAPPSLAAVAVTCAIARGREMGGRLVYKKIDSTLRGPVAAEIAALAAALPEMRILFAPANPAVGRTVRNGVLLVHGVPVAETEFARDPTCPVRESVISRLLGQVAAGRLVVPDAVTAEDLAAAVTQMDATGGPWVAVGSGALARPVAERRAGAGRQMTVDEQQETGDRRREAGVFLAPSPVHQPRSPAHRPLSADPFLGSPDASPLTPAARLMVCGSAHAGNRGQAEVLARERGVRIHEFRVAESEVAVEAALADLRAGQGTAVCIEERRGDSAAVIDALVAGIGRILEETKVSRVFVTGGETAFAMCRAMGISALRFCAEIEPGLSLSRGGDGPGAVVFAIKPGGFGNAHTWVRAWDALTVT